MNKNIKSPNKGFTLIEMLVVVLIIGILAAIALPRYNAAVQRARLAEVETVVKSYIEAQKAYYLVHNKFARYENLKDLDITLPVYNMNDLADRANQHITISQANSMYWFTVDFTRISSGEWFSRQSGIGFQLAANDRQGKIGIIQCRYIGDVNKISSSPEARACESAGYRCTNNTYEFVTCQPNPITWWATNYYKID